MITSEVNFLSFGKREKILRKTHKKYLLYILTYLLIIIFFYNNIKLNYIKYQQFNSIQTYKSINNINSHNQDYLNQILFLVNDMKLFVEKIIYKGNNLSIDVRLTDKKNIYDFIDKLEKQSFSIISYNSTSEENGVFVYNIEVGV